MKICLKLSDGLLRISLAVCRKQRPADCFHWNADGIIGFIHVTHLAYIRFPLHGVLNQICYLTISRSSKIHSLRGIHCLKNAVFRRCDDQMSTLVYHTQEPAVFNRFPDQLLHIVEENVRSGYPQQGSIRAVYRLRTGYAHSAGAEVILHIGKNQFSRLHCLTVPVTVACIIGNERAILLYPVAGNGISHQCSAFGQRKPDIVRSIGGAQGKHQVRHVGENAQLIVYRFCFQSGGKKRLDKQLPVMGGIRPVPGHSSHITRVFKQLCGIVSHHLNANHTIAEQFIGKFRFHLGNTIHVLNDYRIERLCRGACHGGKLPFVGFLGQMRNHIVLRYHGHRVHRRNQKHRNQNQSMSFVFNAAED